MNQTSHTDQGQKQHLSAIVFDFDGVLADSVEVKTRAFAKLYEEFGPEIEAKVVHHHRTHGGMTRADKFNHYHKEFLGTPLSVEDHAALCDRFSRLVVDAVVDADEIPGAKAMLEYWQNSIPLFVDSATPDNELANIIQRRGLSNYFTKIMGSGQSKTDNLKALLDEYDLPPDEVIFFGDAMSDYNAAQACHTCFMGILPNENAPLLQAAPDIVWYPDLISANKALIRTFKE